MLNYIWFALIVLSVFFGGWNGHLKEVTDGAFDGARTAVMTIALPLVGAMSIWLGVMRLAEKSGLIGILAGALRPVLRRLFPDVPPDHPAMGSMVMNIAANMLGLGNAATPLGLRAMGDLERLNPHPGTATNAMCTFLAINTSSVQLIPTTAIAILAAAKAANPTAIVGTSLIATTCAAAAGVTAAKLLQRLPMFAAPRPAAAREESAPGPVVEEALFQPLSTAGRVILWAFALCAAAIAIQTLRLGPVGGNPFVRAVNTVSLLAVPLILTFFPLYAMLRGIKVYEEFVDGAKEGFQVALRIIPFLVAMLMAIFMLRGSGALTLFTAAAGPYLAMVGFPADLLPMTLMRPLSGSATMALFTDVVAHFGPDSPITRMAGTIFGSTETTFYVVAVYFGSVAVRRTRHAIAAGLIADSVGVIASVIVCRALFT